MKKCIALASAFALVLAFALASCAPSSFGVDTDDKGLHAVAKNNASGEATSDFSIEKGNGICINHIVENGSFHVTITDTAGKEVFDGDITNNIADLIDAQGDFHIKITAKRATGTIDVIPYDKEAQSEADATIDEALEQATGKNAEELGLRKSTAGAEPDDYNGTWECVAVTVRGKTQPASDVYPDGFSVTIDEGDTCLLNLKGSESEYLWEMTDEGFRVFDEREILNLEFVVSDDTAEVDYAGGTLLFKIED